MYSKLFTMGSNLYTLYISWLCMVFGMSLAITWTYTSHITMMIHRLLTISIQVVGIPAFTMLHISNSYNEIRSIDIIYNKENNSNGSITLHYTFL